MNYLAHAYLSFQQPEIVVGNIISDFVKGKRKFDYSKGIQTGIALHRAIDEFTDKHPDTLHAKQFFRPIYRLYSAAFIDIVYDHFLANDLTEFSSPDVLINFAADTYQILSIYEGILPEKFKYMFPFMKTHNWLYNYRFPEGIRRSFAGLMRRATYLNESDIAFSIFNNYYDELDSCYKKFFPALKAFANDHLQLLQKNNNYYICIYKKKI